ncbi:MAG: OmpA family protein, partial [Bacteroidota bacterium]
GTGSSTSTNGTINAGTGSTTATGSNVTTAGTTAGKTTGTTTGTTGSSTTGTGSSTGTTGTTNAGTGSTTATGGNGTTAGTTTGSTTGTTTGTTGSTTTGTGSTTKTGGTASGAADQRATVSGVVREAESQKPVQGVDVQLFEGDDMVGQKMTGNDGAYSFDVKSGHQYDLYATRTGYFQGRAELGSVTAGSGQGNIANVSLEPVVANKDIELKNILFDFGKSGLRNESKRELDQLAVFLKANPDLTIELNAHTDTRGDYYPNLLLSYKRAEATRDYLVMRGIDEGRIYSNGFGETFPLVKNAVTDTDHEKNRRVEFRIIDKADVARGEIHSQTGFSVLAGNPYSKARPIPEAEPLPDGLNFRIDLGSYNREVSNDAFSGAFPVVKEWDPQEKVYHYYAGLFNSIDEAEDALKVIKTEVPDASGLKGYFNNNEISEDELKMIRQASGEQVDEDEPKPVLQSDYPVFSIQIGAFTKNLNQSVVADYRRTAGSYGLYINKLNGYTIYSIGLFDDPDRASAVREELIRKGISEKAFLIAWYRGQRITATEAIKMTEKKKP